LQGDLFVTYRGVVTDDDARVFKALADPTRRFLLDRLFVQDGRTLTELESELEMTRFGVMKHLRLLEEAGLVVTRRAGREKRHYLNPVPIRLLHDRWIDKYTEREVGALTALKAELEGTAGPGRGTQRHRLFIRAAAPEVWDAVVGLEYGPPSVDVESERPHRLVQTWTPLFDEAPSRVTVDLDQSEPGLTRLTLTHELAGSPRTAALLAGDVPGEGGWSYVLSQLKSELERAPTG
jgi:DNA-binding transcriptional ArsR family regulator